MKVAFDENIPIGMVKVFQTLANERNFRSYTEGIEIKSAADYAPKRGDADYIKGSDVPWIKRFAADGGNAIISGNTDMKHVPHERLALIEENMMVIFFENRWSNWKFFHKCALLLNWWPVVARRLKRPRPKTFWHIPLTFNPKGRLRQVSTDDPKKLKIEKQMKARDRIRRERKKKREALVIELQEAAQGRFDFMPPAEPRTGNEQTKRK